MTIEIINHWLANPQIYSVYRIVRDIFIILDISIVVGFVWIFIKALEFRPKFSLHPSKQEKKRGAKDQFVIKNWQSVMEKSNSNPPQSLVLAIIEADKLTDTVLKKMDILGEHMADRLEKISSWELKTLDKLWRAHRVRNELVHQPEFSISPADAKEVLKAYENFLKELEVL
ncbi:MAG: hypothetical protein AAB432_02970 [Patescibacteria group bacterium]